jgi:hypothetical protein
MDRMKRPLVKRPLVIWFVLPLLAWTAAAPSAAKAQSDNDQITEKLYTKIVQNAIVGTNADTTGSSIFILANPGIAIDPALNPATSQADRKAISRVLDRVPGPSWIYQEMPYKVSDIYINVLQHHQVAVITMTAKQKRDLKDANNILFKSGDPAKGDSKKLKAYKQARATYQDQVNAVEAHRAPDGSVPPEYNQARQDALQAWGKKGYKDEIDSALAKRDDLTSLDPDSWFQQLSAAYEAAEESPGTPDQFEPVGLYPAYASWSTLKGWATITLSADEIHNLQPTSEIRNLQPTNDVGKSQPGTNTNIGRSTGVKSELWSYSTGASHTNADTQTHGNVNVSSITMDVLRVGIDRSWLDGLIFRSQIWRWSPTAPLGSKLISDGSRPPSTTDILMPYMPTAILVSRNVKISGHVSDVDTKFHSSHMSTSGSLSWGPFAIGGRYEENENAHTFDSKVDGNGIAIPGYQIIGWYCEVLPKSPNPDLVKYKWPSDTP